MNSYVHAHEGHDAVAISQTQIRAMLRQAGLRPTRQRLALAKLLFGRGHRHLSAETLQQEALLAHVPVSLATIYNTLHQFTGAGLLREVAVDRSRTYFDTNTAEHHHLFIEDDNALVDIPSGKMGVEHVPQPPLGYGISRVDVVVRMHRIP